MLVVDVIAKRLLERGVRFVFGMPGGATVPLMAALERVGIDFVLVRHEGSAGFMADAVFQRTGGLGVCIATLGPGVTNLVSGVAQAYTERSKFLAIINQCEDHLVPLYTHQIIDQAAIFSAICHGFHRLRHHNPERHLHKVFQQVDQINGPIVLELSSGISNTECANVECTPRPIVATPAVAAIVDVLTKSTKPVLMVGAEDLSVECSTALGALVRQHNIPVMTTYRAKGMIDESNVLSMGAAGLSPIVDEIQQQLLIQADVIILVGFDMVEMRPNWLSGWLEHASVVSMSAKGQIDIPTVLEVDWRGDIAVGLDRLAAQIKNTEWGWSPSMLIEHKQNLKAIFDDTTSYEVLNPAHAIQQLQQSSPRNTVLCVDVGAHRITASHVWSCIQPRTMLQSNGFSSMGVGLPMAISVKLHEPDTPVVALTGDMGLWMSMGELGVIQERDLHVVVVYLSDSALSLIELKQERSSTPKQTGVRFNNPDALSVAQAFGGKGYVCKTLEDVDRAISEAHAGSGLHLIEIEVDPRYYRAQM